MDRHSLHPSCPEEYRFGGFFKNYLFKSILSMNMLATVVSGVNFYSPFPRIREDGNIIPPIHARNDCCLNKY